MQLHLIDLIIVITYFVLVVGIGIWVSRKGAKDINSYFLGGNKMPWWMLGISDASGMFDVSGTMWLVYVLFVYGLKSVWLPWLWPTFNQVFLFVFLSIWLRRSNVMTGAQWIETRFGTGRGAMLSHISVVAFALISVVGFLAYSFKGIGKFAAIFLPWDLSPDTYAMILMSLTALYAIKGGMFSVVITEVMQFMVLTIASIAVGIIAMNSVSAEMLTKVVPHGWTDITFGWSLGLDWTGVIDSVNKQIEKDGYGMFGIFFILMLFKGVLQSAAGPAPNYDMQRVLATRSPKEAAKMNWLVSIVLYVPRYMMITGLTVLALVYFSHELTTINSNFDMETVLPFTLKNLIPSGWIGLILAGLLAAFMSNYAATINAAPAYVVNDIYKRFINPNADPKKYVRISYMVTFSFVLLGFVFGFLVDSINHITLWIVSALYGGYTASNMLKWYWWRLNGYGYFWGMMAGIVAALLLPLLFPTLTALYAFPVLLLISLAGCIIGSLTTEPESDEVLIKFYMTVRPWGFWKPILEKVQKQYPAFQPNRRFKQDMFNVVVGVIWQISLVTTPIYLVIHETEKMLISIAVLAVTSLSLKFFWWNKLDEASTESMYVEKRPSVIVLDNNGTDSVKPLAVAGNGK